MVVGFYIGFHNPSYVVAMQAIVNACSDKVSLCKLLGINIQPEQWPTIGLPDTILADRGEMMSNKLAQRILNWRKSKKNGERKPKQIIAEEIWKFTKFSAECTKLRNIK
jgi:hypothetical protein